MNHIVLEGVNACGKSTLSKYLSEKLELPVRHPGPRPKSNEIALGDCLRQYMETERVIFDRLTCTTRLAYENRYELNIIHAHMLDRYLSHMQPSCIFIHLTGTGEHIIKDYYTKTHIERVTRDRDLIRSRYFDIFGGIDHFEYDFEVHKPEEVLAYVEACEVQRRSLSGSL